MNLQKKGISHLYSTKGITGNLMMFGAPASHNERSKTHFFSTCDAKMPAFSVLQQSSFLVGTQGFAFLNLAETKLIDFLKDRQGQEQACKARKALTSWKPRRYLPMAFCILEKCSHQRNKHGQHTMTQQPSHWLPGGGGAFQH